MVPIFKYSNIILLEIIKKLLKIYNPNLLLISINFVNIKFNNNSNLKKEDIIYQLILAEAFAARADIRQGKKPVARLNIIDLIKDPYIRITK